LLVTLHRRLPFGPLVALATAALFAAVPAAWAADVGVSISVSQPGVYGRIDIGNFPQPVVLNPQPVIITQPHVVVARPQPVYMWVPPGHQKNWGRYCGRYRACGAPVYFVKDDWYQEHVMHKGRGKKDGDHGGPGHGHGKGHGGGHGKGPKHGD
jgi:hypothetical protein